MILTEKIYNQLLSLPSVPPEVGGILGGHDHIISEMVLDRPQQLQVGIYTPNIGYVNDIIECWWRNGIHFYGLFHTHADNWPTLSSGDRAYINAIMQSLPDEITHLFFPIIFPPYQVKSFKAEKTALGVIISPDEVHII